MGIIKTCDKGHTISNIESGLALHRAFSVFLFDSHGRLLLQRRAASKLTFPRRWANSCCSHPLANEDEAEVGDNFAEKLAGVRRAAERKVFQELGLRVAADEMRFVTRVRYKASGEGGWGEHEG